MRPGQVSLRDDLSTGAGGRHPHPRQTDSRRGSVLLPLQRERLQLERQLGVEASIDHVDPGPLCLALVFGQLKRTNQFTDAVNIL